MNNTPDKANNKFPGFVLGMISADIILCLLNAVFLLFFFMELQKMFAFGVSSGFYFHITFAKAIFSLLVFLTGLSADIMILCRKIQGIRIAYYNISFSAFGLLTVLADFIAMIVFSSRFDKALFVGNTIYSFFVIIAGSFFLLLYFNAVKTANDFIIAQKNLKK